MLRETLYTQNRKLYYLKKNSKENFEKDEQNKILYKIKNPLTNKYNLRFIFLGKFTPGIYSHDNDVTAISL